MDGVFAGLRQRNIKYTVFDGVTGEPSPQMVDDAVNMARAQAAALLRAYGGGACWNLAKCVAAAYK